MVPDENATEYKIKKANNAYDHSLQQEIKNIAEKEKWALKKKSSTNEDPSKIKWFFQREDIVWLNLISVTILHILALYGHLTFPYIQNWRTFLWRKLRL